MFFRRPQFIDVFRLACAAGCIIGAGNLLARNDPGPRGGAAGAGGKFPTLNANETQFFFGRVRAVPGSRFGVGRYHRRNWIGIGTYVQWK